MPDKGKQQKIADCLSSLDDLLEAEGQKLELLRQHKQGLMQQLFPRPSHAQFRLGRRINWESFDLPDRVFSQEDPEIMVADSRNGGILSTKLSGLSETRDTMTADKRSPVVPKLRFPEFKDTVGWQLTPLSDVLDYEQPDDYIVKDTDYQNTGTPVLTTTKHFVLGYTDETDGIYKNVPAIIFDDFTTDAKYVDFPFKVKSSAIKILTSRGDNELKFVYELMCRIRFKPMLHKRYYLSQYQHLEIPMPEKGEQQKIVDCLDTLDDLLAVEGRKLKLLQQHKQGLRQQFFPNQEAR